MAATLTVMNTPSDRPRQRAGRLFAITWADRTDAQAFGQALSDAGFVALVPEPPTPHAALGAAVRLFAGVHGLKASATKKQAKQAPWGLYLPREHSADLIASDGVLTAELSADLVFCQAGPAFHQWTAKSGQGIADVVPTLQLAQQDELRGLGKAALRAWFSGRVAPYFATVATNMGYFAPNRIMSQWERFQRVLELHGHRVTAFDGYDDHRALMLDVHNGLTEDVQGQCKRLEEAITKARSERGLDTVLADVEALESKIGAYDELLGARFDRNELVRLRAAVGAAKLALSAVPTAGS